MAENKRIDEPTGTETVGHEWDGIEELDTPMPRWWLWTLLRHHRLGDRLYRSSIRPGRCSTARPRACSAGRAAAQLEQRDAPSASANARRSMPRIARTPIERLPDDPRAAAGGGRGRARRVPGPLRPVPRLGRGRIAGLSQPQRRRLAVGRRPQGDRHSRSTTASASPSIDETRMSQMPAFGRDGMLQPAQIDDLVAYVRDDLAASSRRAPSARRGAALFAAQLRRLPRPRRPRATAQFGAPNLTDAIWLYGGDARHAARDHRPTAAHGVMPPGAAGSIR